MYKTYGVRKCILGGNFEFQRIECFPGYELNAVQLFDVSTTSIVMWIRSVR